MGTSRWHDGDIGAGDEAFDPGSFGGCSEGDLSELFEGCDGGDQDLEVAYDGDEVFGSGVCRQV